MITQLILLILLSAGGVLGGVVWNKKFEELIPLTNVFIIAVLFIFGMLGFMLEGVYVLCFLSMAAYCFCVYWLIKHRNIKIALGNIITPATVLYVLFFAMITYCNIGRMPVNWDEFSHWADVVKAMVMNNDFSTNEVLQSMFKSYPPGVSLFIYFVEKIHCIIAGSDLYFSEWRQSFAYQFLIFTFVLPFFKECKFKEIGRIGFCFLSIFLLSSTYFGGSALGSTLIDPVLAILIGAGFSWVFVTKERDLWYILQVNAILVLLVLAKDAGLLFAIFILIAFALDLLIVNNKIKLDRQNLLIIGASSLSIIIPKVLWNLSISMNGASKAFSKPYDFAQFFSVLFGQDDTYRATVNQNFWVRLYEDMRPMGVTGAEIPLWLLIVLLSITLVGICWAFITKDKENSLAKISCVATLFVMCIIYFIGMLASYMFKFTEYEAVELASYNRYLNVALFGVVYFIIVVAIRYFAHTKYWNIPFFIFMCILVFCLPWKTFGAYLDRSGIQEAEGKLEYYNISIAHMRRIPDADSRVYIISQEDKGYDYWALRYYARPLKSSWSGWSIGESFYEGDIWTTEMTADEFQSTLNEEYDYVLLFRINGYFVETYADLFEDQEQIAGNSLYYVNKETGLLELY